MCPRNSSSFLTVQKTLTALDSQSVTFLMEALSDAYNPAGDHNEQLREQKVALVRLFMFWSSGDLRRGLTVDAEIAKIKDPKRQRIHDNVVVRVGPLGNLIMEETDLRIRAEGLKRFHPNKINDCMIVAEAEAGQIDWLISYDAELQRRLSPHTHIKILTPVECWKMVEIPRGSKPFLMPDPDQPFAHQTWWRWDK